MTTPTEVTYSKVEALALVPEGIEEVLPIAAAMMGLALSEDEMAFLGRMRERLAATRTPIIVMVESEGAEFPTVRVVLR